MTSKIDENNIADKAITDENYDGVLTQLEMLKRLTLAAKYKDDDTGSHITRMSRYCYEIAIEYRITSYNVCYTKLLRPFSSLFLRKNNWIASYKVKARERSIT